MIDTIIPYLPYAAWCFGGVLGGFFVGALMGASKDEDIWSDGYQGGYDNGLRDGEEESAAAHTRCSDALETARNRIERALEQITPGANATVTRIGRILRGEQG